jgi:hypothetical protein
MRSGLIREKSRASILHFCVSVAVVLVAFLLMWAIVYTPLLFRATGASDIFTLLVAVDVVLGPLLTWVVFDRAKRSLRFDLSVIVVIQLAALTFGVWTLWHARPLYLAALGHRFDLVTLPDIPKEIRKPGTQYPLLLKWVGIKPPDTPKEKSRVLDYALGGVDYGHFVEYHAPIDSMAAELIKEAAPISKLKQFNRGEERAIDLWLAKHGVDENRAKFQGLKAMAQDLTVIIDGTNGRVIGLAPFKPWD